MVSIRPGRQGQGRRRRRQGGGGGFQEGGGQHGGEEVADVVFATEGQRVALFAVYAVGPQTTAAAVAVFNRNEAEVVAFPAVGHHSLAGTQGFRQTPAVVVVGVEDGVFHAGVVE